MSPESAPTQDVVAVLGRVERLAQVLVELVDGPTGGSLAELIAERLVGQLADAQVESLRAVDGASAAVAAGARRVRDQVSALEAALAGAESVGREIRGSVDEVVAAASTAGSATALAVTEQLSAALAGVGRGVTGDALLAAERLLAQLVADVAAGVQHAADEAITGLGEGVAPLVAHVRGLEGAVRESADATSSAVAELVAPLAARLDEVAEGLRLQVERGTQAVVTHLRHTEVALAGAVGDVEQRTAAVSESTWAATEALTTVVESAADRLRTAALEVVAALDGRVETVAAMATQVVADVERAVSKLDRRETAAQARADKRVADLVARTEAQVSVLLDRLSAEVDRLAARDAELERQRAEEFAAVLAEAASGPLAGRRLRQQVARTVGRTTSARTDDVPQEDQ